MTLSTKFFTTNSRTSFHKLSVYITLVFFMGTTSMTIAKTNHSVMVANSMLTMDESNSIEYITAEKKRPTPNTITLLWDTSLRMKDRNFAGEMKLLKEYLNAVKEKKSNANLHIISWGKHKRIEQNFSLKNTAFQQIQDFLAMSFYNGSASTLDLSEKLQKTPDAILLFSDGRSPVVWADNLKGVPVFPINSFKRANHKNLYDMAQEHGGHYIDLTRKEVTNHTLFLLEKIADTFPYENNINGPKSQHEISGIVSGKEGPVNGALVKVRGTFKEAITNSEGAFRIAASDGEYLQVEALNYKRKDTAVGTNQVMNIPLQEDGILLEAALIKGKSKEEEEVNTAFGKRKRSSVGYSTGVKFTSEDIRPEYRSLGDVLQRMNGVMVERDPLGGNERYMLRQTQNNTLQNGGKTFPAIVLDGMVYDQFSQQPPFVNPQDIADIVILSNKASTVKYGQLAAFGAIVIRTKLQANIDNDRNSIEEKQRSLLAKGNVYDENVTTLEQSNAATKPNYLKALEKAASFEEAFKTYQLLAKRQEKNLDFYLHAGTYFMKWHPQFAASILSNIEEVAPTNVRALKALAYTYETLDLVYEATPVLVKLRKQNPEQLQNHLNLARNYVATERYEAAASLYKQMAVNAIEGVDFTPIEQIVINELQHLVWRHKNKITYDDLPKSFLALKKDKEVRFVFDWTDPLMDFEIQFVGPDNKYYTFGHNTYAEPELLEQETQFGFATKDYLMDAVSGDSWLVNIQYKGDKEPSMPRLLKYTVYKDFGLPTEKKEVKVIWIENYTEKVTLDKVTL